MEMKKIAVIVEEIGQNYQSAILNGISDGAAEFNFNIAAFSSLSGNIKNPRHELGELNIFDLPDFSRFDGAILLTNTLSSKHMAAELVERINKAGIPAVSIDKDLPSFYHIGIDNKTAMRCMTEHMINTHGYRNFAYISGPAYNSESSDRLAAFCTVLQEHGLNLAADAVYYGDFRSPSGKDAIEHFKEYLDEMPQAIICANDVMAASAITALTGMGYRVPDDIAVTGFDNTYNRHNFQVELTSVERPLGLSGRLACKMLHNHFCGYPQERNIKLNMSVHFTESCGCRHNALSDIRELKEINCRNYANFENLQNYMTLLNRMSTQLEACNSFDDYISTMKKTAVEIHPEEFYFCLCDNWDSESPVYNPSASNNTEVTVPSTYTENVYVPIAYVNGEFAECSKIRSRDILPEAAFSGTKGRLYYVTPLHFGERCFGYMAVRSSKIKFQNIMFETLCINICNSLENLRKLMCLEYALKKMGDFYARDTFSGIYNRNGFVQATEELYKNCLEEKRNIMVMFIDLDGLKQINDTFGHATGDHAICEIADVLRNTCNRNEIYCRFGGDEFIVFGADYSESEAELLTKRINENIKKVNNSKKNPFELSASTGYFIDIPKQGEDIFYFVTEADKKMYNEKRQKKLSRRLRLSGQDIPKA